MTTDILLLILAGIVLGALLSGLLVWFLINRKLTQEKENEKDDQSFTLLQNQLNELWRTLDTKLGNTNKEMQEVVRQQFGESQRLIRDITEQITNVKNTNKQVVDVAEQLRTLQNTLQNPKQRGVLGEYHLQTVLENMLPPEHFQLQYRFEDGEIADAVIFFEKTKGKQILPIDAKFSLENYNRIMEESDPQERERLEKQFVQDTKLRINETAKYIRPKEGTLDYAFMFIPSEAIYYDLLINKVGSRDLIEYAFREKHVVIVSPTSFMAYLQTVLQGLRALQIEEDAEHIRKNVERLLQHIKSYDQYVEKLGNSLSTTVNHYNTAYRELKKVDKDVMRIQGESADIEPMQVDRPQRGEGE